MKERTLWYFSMVLAMMIALPQVSPADSDEESKLLDAIEVLHEINRIPESAMAPYLLKNAHGIAIIPGVIKLGFVVAGRHGQGLVSVRKASGGWSNPSFVTLTGGSVGWQAGAQSTDVILVFKSRKSIDAIAGGKFTLGADASVAAGPVGRHAEAGTDIMLKSEIYSYSRNRGLFAGVSLEGAALQIDDKANSALYSHQYVTPSQIFGGVPGQPPQVVEDFKKVLSRYAP
jgi:lipid-binding SYLF domain-containing protein